MNATLNRPRTRAINPLQISRVLFYLALALVAGTAGLCYVSLKNTQHDLGERVRKTEAEIKEFRARNQDYQSRIASLSSRMTLRNKLESGFITMVQVPATAIARLTPPAIDNNDNMARAVAANPRLLP
jgi:hypothetical protein